MFIWCFSKTDVILKLSFDHNLIVIYHKSNDNFKIYINFRITQGEHRYDVQNYLAYVDEQI
jgi:hypothetical protein